MSLALSLFFSYACLCVFALWSSQVHAREPRTQNVARTFLTGMNGPARGRQPCTTGRHICVRRLYTRANTQTKDVSIGDAAKIDDGRTVEIGCGERNTALLRSFIAAKEARSRKIEYFLLRGCCRAEEIPHQNDVLFVVFFKMEYFLVRIAWDNRSMSRYYSVCWIGFFFYRQYSFHTCLWKHFARPQTLQLFALSFQSCFVMIKTQIYPCWTKAANSSIPRASLKGTVIGIVRMSGMQSAVVTLQLANTIIDNYVKTFKQLHPESSTEFSVALPYFTYLQLRIQNTLLWHWLNITTTYGRIYDYVIKHLYAIVLLYNLVCFVVVVFVVLLCILNTNYIPRTSFKRTQTRKRFFSRVGFHFRDTGRRWQPCAFWTWIAYARRCAFLSCVGW